LTTKRTIADFPLLVLIFSLYKLIDCARRRFAYVLIQILWNSSAHSFCEQLVKMR